jgi:hypothetical protein
MHHSSFAKLISFLVVGGILTACTPQRLPVVETEIPIQLAPFPTVIATYIAETGNPAEFIEDIRIKTPGLDSRITSPILLEVMLSPSSTGFVRIELTSQSGTLLARQILSIAPNSQTESAELNVPIIFEIDRMTLEAYLIASLEDEYGRLKALDSAAITLLNGGESTIVENNATNPIQITSPEAGATLNGRSLSITGDAATQPGRALNIELITRRGRVLAFGEAYPQLEDGSENGKFSLTLDYEVEEPTWVLIGVAERLSGFIIHYASVEVLLNP